jgi:predicted acylesterase/phospholipase RssA
VQYGLALGAGGARGCAHIGVLRGLETLGVRPVSIAGASMGALVGALAALGQSADDLVRLHLGGRVRMAVRPRFNRVGLLDPAPLIDLVYELVGHTTFADTVVPLAVTAFDLERDERVVLNTGSIAQAVATSMMVPAVFPPMQVAGRWLSDPGIIDSVPVDVAACFGADAVIAVSADLAPTAAGRVTGATWPLSSLLRGTGQWCESVGIRTRWPWARQIGRTCMRASRGKAPFAAPIPVIWIQPAFGRMNGNQFGASERAIRLGEDALRRAAPLLIASDSADEPGLPLDCQSLGSNIAA